MAFCSLEMSTAIGLEGKITGYLEVKATGFMVYLECKQSRFRNSLANIDDNYNTSTPISIRTRFGQFEHDA